MQTTKEVNPHPWIAPYVSICGVSPSYSSYSSCVDVTSPGRAKWSGPRHTINMLHFALFHSVTCCTNSIISRIHVNTTKLRNFVMNANHQRSQPTPLDCTICQCVEYHLLLLLMPHRPSGPSEWTTPHHTIEMFAVCGIP